MYFKIENFRTVSEKQLRRKTFGSFFGNFGQKNFRTNKTSKNNHDTKVYVKTNCDSFYHKYQLTAVTFNEFETFGHHQISDN